MRGRTVDLRDVDVFASVELERRFRAVHLEVQPRVLIVELRQSAQWQVTSVQRNLAGIRLHHKDVVDV